MNGLVVAVKPLHLPAYLAKHGFHSLPEDQLFELLSRAGIWLGPRRLLEENEGFRQLIPYVALRLGGCVAFYRRTVAGSEGRLHGQTSIGFGGHVDASDVVFDGNEIRARATIERAARREISEEAGAHAATIRWLGFLVDNHSEVGRVHLGLAGECIISDEGLRGGEDACSVLGFLSLRDVMDEATEGWSRMMIPGLSNHVP